MNFRKFTILSLVIVSLTVVEVLIFSALRLNLVSNGPCSTNEYTKFNLGKSIPDISPNSKGEPPTARILWWTSFWGNPNVGIPGFGKGDKVRAMAARCEVKCEYVFDKNLASSSHAIVFHAWNDDLNVQKTRQNGKEVFVPSKVPGTRSEDQFYIMYLSEAPARFHFDFKPYANFFNWTITHRHNSDFDNTYGRFQPKSPNEIAAYDAENENALLMETKTNFHIVAWTASNCKEAPSERNELVKKLQEFIHIDIYGKCGNFTCPRKTPFECHKELGKQYKFYLAFENSRCDDYVTEKFFDSLLSNMVPVVYGGANYGLRFPTGSFINVDSFPSAKALASYLLYLNEDTEEYLKYFEWKKHYTVESTRSPNLWCRVCTRLHKEFRKKRSIIDSHEYLFDNRTGFNPACAAPHKFL